ncbi:MAG TPA: hypothetical protein VME01_03920 [Solirubrobacteraceae bacterium]|nr:hypothetical protein [Solirubrobacteraceae bacterium]
MRARFNGAAIADAQEGRRVPGNDGATLAATPDAHTGGMPGSSELGDFLRARRDQDALALLSMIASGNEPEDASR